MDHTHPLEKLLGSTMSTMKGLVDANAVIGTPIEAQGVTLIPVSRLSVGVGGGGSDYISKNQKPDHNNTFGGGAGASGKIEPIAFLMVQGDTVKVLPVMPGAASLADRVLDSVPGLVDKLTEFMEDQKEKKAEKKDFVKEKGL